MIYPGNSNFTITFKIIIDSLNLRIIKTTFVIACYIYNMKMFVSVCTLVLFLQEMATAQSRREDIYTDFVLYNKRMLIQKDLKENTIGKTFSQPIDSNTEYRFEAACNAITQYMFSDETVKQGFEKLFIRYDELQYETKKAFLEALYAVCTTEYLADIQQILAKETQPKLFSIAAVYAYRAEPSVNNANHLKLRMAEQFPGYDTLDILLEL